MLAHHFAHRLEERPVGGQPPAREFARATLAEIERAVRDPACTSVVVRPPELGHVEVSKAAVRARLQRLRRLDPPPQYLYITIGNDGSLTFDQAAADAFRDRGMMVRDPL